ncbi:hypothetical protein FJTKL_08624 [Diaporthe vaccinii]|uniref:GrpB domain-containing protein n=1 Tax=Diaporthe vaccinii TaxID=105482 RepID=A0ABR4ER30_9PEZI
MESIGYTSATLEVLAKRTDPDTEISPYQTSWPQTFNQVAARIQSALGESALRLEHVGSTSVPRLAAKPIIDILLEVVDPSNENAYVPKLEELGFILHFRQPKWHGHRFLALALNEHDAEINVHVHRAGCQVAAQFLTFRDFLRDNAWAREQYVEAKRKAAETSNEEKGGRLQYQREKAAVLDRLKARALEENPSPPCSHCRVG